MSTRLEPQLLDPALWRHDGAGALARALALARVGDVAYASGNLDLLTRPRVSIAGSRRAEGWSLTAMEALAARLAGEGLVIVSGGAIGTDVAAHRGALMAGGSTIIVPPFDLGEIDPRTWRPGLAPCLDADRVLYLGPFGPGHRATRSSPIIRNRLIAALGSVAIAGQTAEQSGTNHFLSVGVELGRPIFVLASTAAGRLAPPWPGAVTFRVEDALDPGFARRIAEVAAAAEATRRAQGDLFAADGQA